MIAAVIQTGWGSNESMSRDEMISSGWGEEDGDRRRRTSSRLLDASEALSAPNNIVVEDVDLAAELAELGVLSVNFLSVGGAKVSERSLERERKRKRTQQW